MSQTQQVAEEQIAYPHPLHTAGGLTLATPIFQPGVCIADRYIIERLISQGGFGRTYLARDRRLLARNGYRPRRYIIKQMIRPAPADAEERKHYEERLEREMAVMVDLNSPGHPNIPDIYEYLPEHACLVIKYIEGKSLAAILRARREPFLAEQKALRYARDVCSALAYMHQRRGPDGRPAPIIHRDVTPSNIMRDLLGRIWLIDFGLSQLYSATDPGQNGDSSGTEGFAPPEQRNGRAEPRSDTYALGATLQALICGLPEQVGTANSTARPKPSRVVARLIERAIADSPAGRPDAQGMLVELDGALSRHSTRRQQGFGLAALLALVTAWLFGFVPQPDIVWDTVRGDPVVSSAVLTPGEPALGPISRFVRVDEWTFAGMPQQSITIRLIGQPQTGLQALSLVDGDGEDMTTRGCVTRNLRLVCLLEEEGTHKVRVQNESLGPAYTLLVDPLAAEEVPPADELDWSFLADAGDRVTVECRDGSSGTGLVDDPQFVLRSSSGEEVAGTDGRYRIPANDLYTVSYIDRDDTPDGCAVQVADPRFLTAPADRRGGLTWEQPSERWTFLGQPGEVVELTVYGDTGADGLSDPILDLYDPQGELVASNDDYNGDNYDAQIVTVLDRVGVYTVVVTEFEGMAGAYRLTIR